MDVCVAWLAFPLGVWWLPGFFVARKLAPEGKPLDVFALSALAGPILCLPLSFMLAYPWRVALGPYSVLGASAIASAGIWWVTRRWARPSVAPGHGEASGAGDRIIVVGLVALAVAQMLLARYVAESTTDFFSPCPLKSALFLISDQNTPGVEVFDPSWGVAVTHHSPHPTEPGFGLAPVLEQQRPGSATAFAHGLMFHGVGAAPAITFALSVLVGTGIALLLRRHLRAPYLVLGMTAALLAAFHTVAGYMVNENVLVLGLLLHALHWLWPAEPGATEAPLLPRLWIGSLAIALALGVRPELVVVFPALAGLALWPSGTRQERGARLALVLLTLVVGYLPWGLVTTECFGHPLANPALNNLMTVTRFAGQEVLFHPLNFPFASELMRPEWRPYPTLLQLPLEHLQAFGVVMTVAILAGVVCTPWRRLALLAGFGGPIYLILLFIVTMDHPKMSYSLLAMAPIPWLAGRGVASMASMTRLRWVSVVGLSFLVTFVLPLAVAGLNLPVDTRPQVGEREESQISLAQQRAALTQPYLLPRLGREGQGLEWVTAQLGAAGPPRRSAGTTAERAVVWRYSDAVDLDLEVRLHASASIPPPVADTESEPFRTDRFLATSVEVATDADVAEVKVEWTDDYASVSVTAPRGAGRRYLFVGLRDRQWSGLRLGDPGRGALAHLQVSINGKPQPLRHFLATRAGETTLRLVANHPWRFRPLGAGFQLEPGEWVCDCRPLRVGGRVITPLQRAYSEGAGEAFVLAQESAQWPPEDPEPCASGGHDPHGM